ncbi:MAG: NADPH:quinone reductase [Planctomycetales bacterium]|nr:NADPH:quinone reductase [Planctomycetales bacterium]
MKAAFITEPGPPDCIQYGDVPDPVAAAGQVLVRVSAVSVNPIDTYIRGGANFWPLPKPFIIGCDFAGTVAAVGEGVRGLSLGDRVWGSNQGLLGRQGTFAEYCAVDSQWVYPTPDGVSDETMAAAALVAITAHLGLFQRAHIQPGATVFVRGGVGGVGSMVVQMAKTAGAKVIATAGSERKATACRQLGADMVIDYTRESIGDKLKEYAPNGVDLFWETLRDPDFDLAVGALAENGRIVLMAGRDARPQFPVGPFYVKGGSIHGVVMFKASAAQQRQCASDINHWFASGKLSALIDRRLPLSEAAQAHAVQEQHTIAKQSQLTGKIVLLP